MHGLSSLRYLESPGSSTQAQRGHSMSEIRGSFPARLPPEQGSWTGGPGHASWGGRVPERPDDS